MSMHCPKMIPTMCMALIAMLLSPCIVAFQFNIPKPYLPVPSYRHGTQGRARAFPPLPPYHVKSPPLQTPAAPTNSPVWPVPPPPVHTPQSPPAVHDRNYPGFPNPFQRHPMIPIPRHRSSPPPPPVSGVAQPPTPYVTTPTPTPPTDMYSYLLAPVQPPVSSVPHSQYPPSPPHSRFLPSPPHHHPFLPSPPHRQFPPFPPRHQFPPFPPRHQVQPLGTFPAPGPVPN